MRRPRFTEMMTTDDHARLNAIMLEWDDRARAALIGKYWRDLDRAERTDRRYAYLHIGILAGTVFRLLDDRATHGQKAV